MLIEVQKTAIAIRIINLVGIFIEHSDNMHDDKKIIAAVIMQGITLVVKNGSEEIPLLLDQYNTKKIVPVASVFIAKLARINNKRLDKEPYIERFLEIKTNATMYEITIAIIIEIIGGIKTPQNVL